MGHLLPQSDISDVSAGKVDVWVCASAFLWRLFHLLTSSSHPRNYSSGKQLLHCCCVADTDLTFEPPSEATKRRSHDHYVSRTRVGTVRVVCASTKISLSCRWAVLMSLHHAYPGISCFHAPWIWYLMLRVEWKQSFVKRKGQGSVDTVQRRHAMSTTRKRCFYLFVEAMGTLQLLNPPSILLYVFMTDQAQLIVIFL